MGGQLAKHFDNDKRQKPCEMAEKNQPDTPPQKLSSHQMPAHVVRLFGQKGKGNANGKGTKLIMAKCGHWAMKVR